MFEYMLLIRNDINHQAGWSNEQHQEFLKKCEIYILDLKASNNIISAQPLERKGCIIRDPIGEWKEDSFKERKEIIVGYYHIRANSIDDAIEIAKRNPEFEYGTTARVEVRPIKTVEENTEFVYPV